MLPRKTRPKATAGVEYTGPPRSKLEPWVLERQTKAPLDALQREHLARVVGAVEDALVERQAALDRAGGAHLPVGLAGLAVERVDVARLASRRSRSSRRSPARSRCGPGSGKRHSSLPSLARIASASPSSIPGARCSVTA